jgi:hypothetical protein
MNLLEAAKISETRPLTFNGVVTFWCKIRVGPMKTKLTLFRRNGIYYSQIGRAHV